MCSLLFVFVSVLLWCVGLFGWKTHKHYDFLKNLLAPGKNHTRSASHTSSPPLPSCLPVMLTLQREGLLTIWCWVGSDGSATGHIWPNQTCCIVKVLPGEWLFGLTSPPVVFLCFLLLTRIKPIHLLIIAWKNYDNKKIAVLYMMIYHFWTVYG